MEWCGKKYPKPDPDLDFLPIPDPVVKKSPDPGSGSATLPTRIFCHCEMKRRHLVSVLFGRKPIIISAFAYVPPLVDVLHSVRFLLLLLLLPLLINGCKLKKWRVYVISLSNLPISFKMKWFRTMFIIIEHHFWRPCSYVYSIFLYLVSKGTLIDYDWFLDSLLHKLAWFHLVKCFVKARQRNCCIPSRSKNVHSDCCIR